MFQATVTLDLDSFVHALDGIAMRVQDLHPLLEDIGQVMKASTEANFEGEREPSGLQWKDLKKSTVERRTRRGTWPGQILTETGTLRESMGVFIGPDYVEIGTNVPYGKYHMTGTTRMPARPFLGIPGDKSTLAEVINSHFSNISV